MPEEKTKKDKSPQNVPKDVPKKDKKTEEKEQVLEIVRVLSTDLDGKKKIKNSLRKIKGISFMVAKIFCEKACVDPGKLTGKLTEKEIKSLEEVITNPTKFEIPSHILNFRNDPQTGKDFHFTGAELQIKTRNVIGDMKKLGSYRGMRHRSGLPVRGQRTRSSFRKQKSVGVSKKKQQPGRK